MFSGHVGSLFCVFSGLPWFSGAGNASFRLELGFAKVLALEEPLALRSDKNKVYGINLSVFLERCGAGVSAGRGACGLEFGTWDWFGLGLGIWVGDW